VKQPSKPSLTAWAPFAFRYNSCEAQFTMDQQLISLINKASWFYLRKAD
jgi:hypothetical protein